MNFFNKLFFLYKSKSLFVIYISYIKNKFLNIFIKSKIKQFKKNHQLFLRKKKITHDYFSSHTYNFYQILKNFDHFSYLEIGSFEGNSAIYVAQNFPNSSIHCVDNWFGTEEYGNLKFSNIEKNFDNNTILFKNLKKYKITSDNFFIENKKKFEVIYIDGHHKGTQVLKDFKNSWKFLKKGGVLIFDDFIWQFYDKLEDNPCYVINQYLRIIYKQVKILKVSNSQLFIKKIN